MTVFLSFVLTMVLGLFFTMSEVLRFFCLKKQTERASLIAVESCFADYCRPLWEEYGLLGVDLSYGKDELDTETFEKRYFRYLDENGNAEGTHFFQAYPKKAALLDHSVLTDNDYAGLVREAAKSVENNIGEDALSMLQELTGKVKGAEEGSDGLSDLAGSGEDVMNGDSPPASVKTVEGTEPSEETKKKIRGCENPLLGIVPVSVSGILKLVLPSGASVSDEKLLIPRSERCSARALESGTMSDDTPKAHEKALYAPRSGHYNLGTGKGLSVREILETARKVTGKPIPAEVVPRRPGDPPRLIACSDLARKELGWQPQFENAGAIIESVWKWMAKYPNGYQDR